MLSKINTFNLRRKSDGFTSTLKYFFYKFYFNYKLSHLDLTKEKIVTVNGCKMFLLPNDKGISAELLLFKKHEPLHTELLSRELKAGMVCIDIGSNIGYYATLESKLVKKNGKVISIEPSPPNFKILQKNVKLQNFSNIETYNFACGDCDGTVKFSVSNRSNWSRVVSEKESESMKDEDLTIIDVPIKKLDTFLTEIPKTKIDIIRMDIEGYEYAALRGMTQTIEKHKPLLIFELHQVFLGFEKTKEMLLDLKNIGYEIKYYINRDMDMPLIGNKMDIKKITIDNLIEKLKKGSPYGKVVTIFLVNSIIKS